jgi:hypothetical protein
MTRTAGRTAWCATCHHLVRLTLRTGYLHVSDDDWSELSCPCANQLRPCVPEPRIAGRLRRQAPWTYLGETSGTVTFSSGTVTLGPGRLYARSYTEAIDLPPKEQP